MSVNNTVKVLDGFTSDNIPLDVINGNEPVILKGLVKSWPLVQVAKESDDKTVEYLNSHYSGKPSAVYIGEPSIKGRFFYNDDVSDLNFSIKRMPLNDMLADIIANKAKDDAPAIYIASNNVEQYFPSLLQYNDLQFPDSFFKPLTPQQAGLVKSIWIGNATTATCHFDTPANIACCVAGKRHFTLFPPQQVENLYPGPINPTPGGQVVSMVDFDEPDFGVHPKFKIALAQAQIAELEPGDALFIPSMWWHHVKGLSDFNILVNFWWNSVPYFHGIPMNAMMHSLLSIRDRPEHEKQAWKALFDYYIFSSPDIANSHLPIAARGLLAPLDEMQARRLRAEITNKLNR